MYYHSLNRVDQKDYLADECVVATESNATLSGPLLNATLLKDVDVEVVFGEDPMGIETNFQDIGVWNTTDGVSFTMIQSGIAGATVQVSRAVSPI